ncbi:MAG: nucleotide sugar dehydrogenase [Armatimonadetes bacterium]|nr:nucleotide sugar dehydrogenase [Armatimonadota bacterium]
MEQICVLGLGYIGLPTATLAASSGYKVRGVDIDPNVIDCLSAGRAHIAEPELQASVARVIADGSLTVSSSPCPADVFLIAVPTPIKEDKTADLNCVTHAAQMISENLQNGALVIVESTVPPGTTSNVVIPILEESGLSAGKDFYVAYCPERVLPGKIIIELMNNDRVIGGLNTESAVRAARFYRRFVRADMYITNLITAEIVKLVENAFRDVNVAFANEISLISQQLGANVWEVIDLANKHPRVNILNPGPGVGGHCIAVDPWFLVESVPEATALIKAARQLNDSMPERIISWVESVVPPGAKIACLGAAYKANVGDTRESPALRIIYSLKEKGYELYVVDPYVENLNGLVLVSLNEALDSADCLLLLVDHDEFKSLDIDRLREKFGNGRLMDTRGIWVKGRTIRVS